MLEGKGGMTVKERSYVWICPTSRLTISRFIVTKTSTKAIAGHKKFVYLHFFFDFITRKSLVGFFIAISGDNGNPAARPLFPQCCQQSFDPEGKREKNILA